MTSVQFVPFLPIVAQVAGIDINKCKLLEDDMKHYISLQIMIQILQSKFLITSLYLYVVMPLVPLLEKVAQIEH